MNHWLLKTEPSTFSLDDLAERGTEPWDGIRNYQARNFIRDDMREGDKVLVYHSSCAEPAIVGVARVASAAYPDPTQFDPDNSHYDAASLADAPRWWLVDVGFVRRLKRPLPLAELKTRPELASMRLLQRGNRLSVLPLTKAEWTQLLGLEKLPQGD